MSKPLCDLLAAHPATSRVGDGRLWNRLNTTPITALCCDSRLAGAGTVFFCLVGKTSDGHLYAPGAYRNGCRVFVVQTPQELPTDAVQWVVDDSRHALADCAAAFYDHPEKEMRLVGLTGTKGKTTTAILIRHLLCGAGIPAGYIGTNGVDFADYHTPTLNSTPESLELYRYLRMMADSGVKTCVLEVSSQALWMERVRGLLFDTTLFTNLHRDHIGGVEHPDMEHYQASKRRLFTDYPAAATVWNRDDPAAEDMVSGGTAPVALAYGMGNAGDPPSSTSTGKTLWWADDVHPARKDGRIGVRFCCHRGDEVLGEWFLPLPGAFNVQNALAALTVACERFGVAPEQARVLLEQATVPGRFETVTHPALPDVTFVIDYAHNGVSLAAILDALRDYRPGRLIALFGSVGGRTFERRRDLAEAASGRADLCILTSDNPAAEPPMDILSAIDNAFPQGSCSRILEPDRAEAIRLAVEMARPGDIILLAGKGHEDYQLIGSRRVPFSEVRVLTEALEARCAAGIPS